MERKIGEIFEYNGEWYQCVEGYHCYDCDFRHENGTCIIYANYPESKMGNCNGNYRTDNQNVVFKKLEKIGEPYKLGEVLIQQYQGIAPIVLPEDLECSSIFRVISSINVIEIKLKQNKEDMEENKLNLKPFDIQKAREGKTVCTRDGRKARIICFDRNCQNAEGENYPIVALIANDNGTEEVVMYDDKGVSMYSLNHENDYDLMMLHEKKEGWVNVYRDCDGMNITKDDNIYSSKDAAISSAQIIDRDNYVATVKINWEE